MKKLRSLALYALIAPAVTLGMGSALAQTERSKPEPTQVQQGPTEREKGPHVVTTPQAEHTAVETETDKRAQQERADQDTTQAQGASQDTDQRTAQDSTPALRAARPPYLTSEPANSFRVNQLIGANLKSRTDAGTIGSISDLVIDEDGQVLAVIVEVGGFLGLGQKNVAIPWGSVERTPNEKADGYELHVSADKEALTDAPEYQTEAGR